jgi:uncharacterized protein YuzE
MSRAECVFCVDERFADYHLEEGLMANVSSFNVTYDADSDVLYLSKRKAAAARGLEDGSGIVWRYDRNGELIGATVLDFHEIWAGRSDVLANELSIRFELPVPQMRVVVDRALDDGDV